MKNGKPLLKYTAALLLHETMTTLQIVGAGMIAAGAMFGENFRHTKSSRRK